MFSYSNFENSYFTVYNSLLAISPHVFGNRLSLTSTQFRSLERHTCLPIGAKRWFVGPRTPGKVPEFGCSSSTAGNTNYSTKAFKQSFYKLQISNQRLWQQTSILISGDWGPSSVLQRHWKIAKGGRILIQQCLGAHSYWRETNH